ncbi:hypothetical protein NPIL_453741 [Nephila pilipes]|uniref:Uncharacterized protein n=1 Tax=Nephila pilipes TaxID=299642 RepID=A0A8X6QW67_NEPPI|nr:hypothetical protein NPIL_453741 [Nephila pilipes]
MIWKGTLRLGKVIRSDCFICKPDKCVFLLCPHGLTRAQGINSLGVNDPSRKEYKRDAEMLLMKQFEETINREKYGKDGNIQLTKVKVIIWGFLRPVDKLIPLEWSMKPDFLYQRTGVRRGADDFSSNFNPGREKFFQSRYEI